MLRLSVPQPGLRQQLPMAAPLDDAARISSQKRQEASR